MLAEDGPSVVSTARFVSLVRAQPLPEGGFRPLAHRVSADPNDPQATRVLGPILARFLKEIHPLGREHCVATVLAQAATLVRAGRESRKERIEPLDVICAGAHDDPANACNSRSCFPIPSALNGTLTIKPLAL